MAFNTGIVTKESARRVLGQANRNSLPAANTQSLNSYGWSNGVFNKKPDTTTTNTAAATIDDPKRAKAIAYLKEYVGQMRAAGFSDAGIRSKLESMGTVKIPNSLPENFGQAGIWASGMADELKRSSKTPAPEQFIIPSPDEYLSYMPGYKSSGVPSLSELKELSSSTGKFSRTRYENLSNALQEYIANYDGPKVPVNNDTLAAGIAGMPLELGMQYYQDYNASLAGNEENAQNQQEYEDLVMQYPEITTFTPGASAEENAAKIREYYEGVKQQEQKPELSAIVAQLNDAVYQATINGETVNMEDVMNAALMMGTKISYDEAMAIFNSAKQQALRDMGNNG